MYYNVEIVDLNTLSESPLVNVPRTPVVWVVKYKKREYLSCALIFRTDKRKSKKKYFIFPT